MTLQSAFTAALLDPAAAVPPGLIDPQGRPAGKRFDVYRNNVAVSLTEALETGFPVLRKLLGEQNFKGLSGIYLRTHPPASPLMMHYGGEMPAFLETLQQLAHLPYLADVARLELGLRASYHAADAAPADPAALSAIPPEDLDGTRLRLAPATRVLSSDWPILGIWLRNSRADAPKPQMRPEDVLVTRPEFDPAPQLLPPGGALVVTALISGATLAEAADKAPETDLSQILAALIAGRAITEIEAPK